MKIIGKVEDITIRTVTTKFGTKPTYTLLVGGVGYQAGFTKPRCSIGDVVEFDSVNSKYGEEIVKGSLSVSTGIPTPPTTTASAPVTESHAKVSDVARPRDRFEGRRFPIDALAAERSIIRQNALTQARELVCAYSPVNEDVTEEPALMAKADLVIRVAKKFEAYSSGDLDMAEVKAEVLASKAAA